MSNTHEYLILVTPTYNEPNGCRSGFFAQRIEQLKKVEQKYFWIICEDGSEPNAELNYALKEANINYVYIAHGPTNDKGNEQRNACYDFIVDNGLEGLVYNMDDDNLVDEKIYAELLKTEKDSVGVFAIGNIWGPGPYGREVPKLSPHGKISGWHAWDRNRTFPCDMGTFCFDTKYLYEKRDKGLKLWDFRGRGGENEFLLSILGESYQELQPIMDNCTKIYAWHNELLYRKMEPKEQKKRDREHVLRMERKRLNMNLDMNSIRDGKHSKEIKKHPSAGRHGPMPPEAKVRGIWR
jgi:hypothetical protein